MRHSHGSAPVLLLGEQLCFALYATSRAVTASYRPFLDRMGITYPQYLVLMVLWERGTVTMKELAGDLRLDYGTLSPLVKRLAAAGLVERERRAEDERTVWITPTARGVDLQHDAECMVAAVLEQSGLTLEDVSDLRGQLEILTGRLSAPPGAAG